VYQFRKRILPTVAFATVAVACRDISTPSETSLKPATATFTISDGAHGGSARLYFLPPLVTQPTFSGTFDPTAFAAGSNDEVFVCVLAGTQCGSTIATFTGGTGPSSVQMDPTTESYHVAWQTRSQQPPLDASQLYRIVVRVNNIDVGYSDVIPVQLGGTPPAVNHSQYGIVRIGTVLQIAFRLETASAPPPPSGPIGVRAFADRTCIINGSGQLFCWGADFSSPANPIPTPAPFGPPDPTYVAIGSGNGLASHACAIHGNASQVGGTASCWGNDEWGQIGNGTGDGTTVINVSAPNLVNGPPFTSITQGAVHSCGLTVDGAAYCWGDNSVGELGDGTTQLRNTPVPVSGGLTFKSISAGQFHTCAVTVQGAAYCWGSIANGDLGTNLSLGPSQTTPIAVRGPNLGTPLVFTSVAAGPWVTCGITTDGSAYCWGRGFWGQLGDGSQSDSPYPSPVSGGYLFSQISIGGNHACGVTTAGVGLCWGYNQNGQLGNGTSGVTITTAPGTVSFVGVTLTQISAGASHTCAIATGGSLYCWGDNSLGEIGDGTTTQRTLPTLVNFP
jgi:alpha-tubulin suppressor-like RCC1 family protein